MPNGMRTYKCWCGSTDFESNPNDGTLTCKSCGSKCIAQDGCLKFKIQSNMNDMQFMRAVWIFLARKDAPLDVFDCDFTKIGYLEYQAMIDTVYVEMPYDVSIGNDRIEYYWTTETRKVSEPFRVRKQEYDYSLDTWVDRDEIEYRYVDKEFQVQRSRTVTDWRRVSSTYSDSSSVCIRNGHNLAVSYSFDEGYDGGDDYGLSFGGNPVESVDDSLIFFNAKGFQTSLSNAGPGEIVAPNESERNIMGIDSSVEYEAGKMHRDKIEPGFFEHVRKIGDYYRDLNYSYTVATESTDLFIVPEYYATIGYNGRNYTIECLSFAGQLAIGGEIENPTGVRAYKEKRMGELSASEKKIREYNSKDLWKKCGGILIAATVLLSFAIVGLIVTGAMGYAFYVSEPDLGYPFVMFVLLAAFSIMFIAAVSVYIVSAALTHSREKKIISLEGEELNSLEYYANEDISDFTEEYKTEQLARLNKKFESLGLEPATDNEICDIQ